jgi:peroxiredoxin
MRNVLFGASLIAVGLTLAVTWAVVYQLIQQNGRMLARLDDLEQRQGGSKALTNSRIERDGIKAGTPAPHFELPDIYGRRVSLAEFRGRQVFLVFTDPECGPCDEVAPYLVRLHREHAANGLSVVMIGRGHPAENRRKAEQHGFEFPVALQRRWEVSMQYGIFATPVAFLIGADGVITHNVAKGMDEIVLLTQNSSALGPQSRTAMASTSTR